MCESPTATLPFVSAPALLVTPGGVKNFKASQDLKGHFLRLASQSLSGQLESMWGLIGSLKMSQPISEDGILCGSKFYFSQNV